MSGPFEEAAQQLSACKDRTEEAMAAQRGAQEIIRDLHGQLAAIYGGVDAGNEIQSVVDLADNHADEVLEVLARAVDMLDGAIQRALSGNA